MSGLEGRGIVVILGGRRILDGIDIDVTPGAVTAIVGPNGAGKSTLLNVLAGDIVPQTGSVTLNGRPLSEWSSEERALQRAVLPQTPELAFSFRAWDVVELGRHPYRSRASAAENRAAVQGAMDATETMDVAHRDTRTLSGGELHRTHYARALAQLWSPLESGHSRFLLVDEPTSSLDLFHQHAILSKAREVARSGAGVLAVLHDLNLAAAYADNVLVLTNGRSDALGTPEQVLTKERISRIWRVNCDVARNDDGKLHIVVRPQRKESV